LAAPTPPRSSFPYTTLFRSGEARQRRLWPSVLTTVAVPVAGSEPPLVGGGGVVPVSPPGASRPAETERVETQALAPLQLTGSQVDRKSTRLNSSHVQMS